MEIEYIIAIEIILRDLIPDITNIIFQFANINYNQLINNHIDHQKI